MVIQSRQTALEARGGEVFARAGGCHWLHRGYQKRRVAVWGGILETGDAVREKQSLLRSCIDQAPLVPGRVDALLARIAGEGNAILHWFLRIVTIVSLAGAISLGILGVAMWQASHPPFRPHHGRNQPRPYTPPATGSSAGAHVMAQEFVEDRLVAPRTAKWPWSYRSDGVEIRKLGSGLWRVESWVDSQNSFGAMIRTRYVCTVRTTDGKNWKLISLETAP